MAREGGINLVFTVFDINEDDQEAIEHAFAGLDHLMASLAGYESEWKVEAPPATFEFLEWDNWFASHGGLVSSEDD